MVKANHALSNSAQVYKLTVVREGEPMLGRNSDQLAISIFWFVTSSLVFLFTFLWRRFK